MISTSRRSSLSLQLVRHFSIRVSPLNKQSLVAQLLRGNGASKLTKSPQTRRNGSKASHLLQQGVELENGRLLVEYVSCSDDSANLSMRHKKKSKEAQHSDGATTLSVLSLRESRKAYHCEDETTELPMPSKLSVPSTRKGSKAHHRIGDMQSSLGAQTSSKRGEASYADGKPFPTERRKVDTAKVSVQPQIAGEEGHHSHGPLVSKPGEKCLRLQTRGASQKPCLPVSKLGISPLRTGSSKEISSLISQVRDEPGKCTTGKVSSTKRDEEDDAQNAGKHTHFLMKYAVGSGTSKVKNFVGVNSVNEPAPLTHVKALSMEREILFATSEKFAQVFTALKVFFESGDMAYEILTYNTRIFVQPPERLQQRLKVLDEFEVDKATCYSVCIRPYLNTTKAEKYRSVLSFLKDLGLSAESRNRMLCKFPYIVRFSVKNRMQPIVNFFESKGIARPTLLKLLESRPATLSSSLDKDLRHMHEFFQHMGLSAVEFVETLKKLSPYKSNLFSLGYHFFREQGLSDEAVASMIKRNPDFLARSVESLHKLHFILRTAKRD